MYQVSEVRSGRGFQDKAEKPPCSNTGVKWTRQVMVGIDWLAGSYPSPRSDSNVRVMAMCERYFGDRLDYVLGPGGESVGSRWYRFLLTGPSGVRLETSARTMPDDASKQHSLLIIPGKALQLLSYEQLYRLINELLSIGWSPSRVDLKLDDFKKRIRPEVILDACRAGNVKGFRKYRYIGESYIGQSLDDTASTLYLGTRGSRGAGKYIRVYRKDLESDGHVDSCRLELELSGDRSKDVVTALGAVDLDEWPSVIVGFISSAVDFLDRSVSTRADRCPRLEWWHEIVDDALSIPFSPRVIRPSFERSLKWLKSQVLPSLAMVLEGLCIEARDTQAALSAFYDWWSEGERRFEDRHRAVLRQWELQCTRLLLVS